jgi:hypothetical protein
LGGVSQILRGFSLVPRAEGLRGSNCPCFQGTCNFCKRTGHREAQCFNKLRDQCDAAKAAVVSGVLNMDSMNTPSSPDNLGFIATEDCPPVALVFSKVTFFNKNLLIFDTGESCHMTCSNEGMHNC